MYPVARKIGIYTGMWAIMFWAAPILSQQDSLQEESCPQIRSAGFLQQYFTADPERTSSPTFLIRRARVGLIAQISEKVSINMSIGGLEPPDNTPAMINAFAVIKIHEMFSLKTGQFFVPFGYEGQTGVFRLIPLERAHSTRRMNPNRLFRDVGFEVFGQKGKFNYRLALLNGVGANQIEKVNLKDIALRLELDLSEQISMGISGLLGDDETVQSEPVKKNRFGAHFLYKGSSDKYRLIMEYSMLERGVNTWHGGYLLSAIKIVDKWEGLVRYDYLEQDGIGNSYHGWTLGSNFQYTDKLRFSLNGIGYTQTSDLNELDFSLTLQLQFVL